MRLVAVSVLGCAAASLVLVASAANPEAQQFQVPVGEADHPRDEYRFRPAGVVLFTVAMADRERSPAQGDALTAITDATIVARVGKEIGARHEMFGDIGTVTLDDTGRLFVLDEDFEEVRVFDEAGRHLETFGRAGEGPGEFVNPLSLATWDGTVIVGDLRRRLQVFSRAESPATYDHAIDLPMRPLAVCFAGSRMVLHGARAIDDGGDSERPVRYSVIHTLDADGAFLRSFGAAYESPNRIINQQVADGHSSHRPRQASRAASRAIWSLCPRAARRTSAILSRWWSQPRLEAS